MQRIVLEGEGGHRQANYTLYAVAPASADIFHLDGDALGVALAPVFLAGLSDELAPLFPRVAARFQLTRGDQDTMRTFLFQQLGISADAQASALELLIGGGEVAPAHTEAPAPR